MRTSNILWVAVLALLAALSVSACGGSRTDSTQHDGNDEAGHSNAPVTKAPADDKHAGKGAHADEGHIELSEEAARAAGIELATTGKARIRDVLPLYGTVQLNAERAREVSARYPGVIRSVTKRLGDPVREGETLATVESNESLRSYSVTAPLSGVITARRANTGETAGEASLFTVADLSTVWVELSLFPRDLAKVRVGQKVRVRSVDAALSSEGEIVYVSALGQSTSQTLAARVLLENRERAWAPGFYVSAEVILSEADVPIAVKSNALQALGNDTVVFVHSEHGFEPHAVAPGRSDGEHTEIRSGLSAGQRYAAANSFVLKSELGKGEAGHDH